MMPAVTVCCSPNGEPMASTQSPTLSRSESPSGAAGNGPAALQPEHGEIGARSVPTTLALCFLPSAVTTSMSVARSTTWALVRAMPEASTMTPEPRLRCCCSRSGASPKKRRKNSSPKNSSTGVRPPLARGERC